MQRPRTVSDTVVVPAEPAEVYGLVADPTRTPRWSPENTGASASRSGPLRVGDRFVGTNRRGRLSWRTESVVTTADVGRAFAFQVQRWGLPKGPSVRVANASWEYRLEPVDGGTRVTETWTDDRAWPDAVCAVADRVFTGGSLFSEFQRRNIRTSLDRLRDQIDAGLR